MDDNNASEREFNICFQNSSQVRDWTFDSYDEMDEHRETARKAYIMQSFLEARNEASVKLIEAVRAMENVDEDSFMKTCGEFFFTGEEERRYLLKYEEKMRSMASKMKPEMPKEAVAKAFYFFRRFYLLNSPMQYHPKAISVTCLFVAAKADDFYLPLQKLVKNIKGDQESASQSIFHMEPVVIHKIKHDLTVFLPFRAFEGLLIDFKARFAYRIYHNPHEAEELRPETNRFLESAVLLSYVSMRFSPSQIALAAIVNAGAACGKELRPYVELLVSDSFASRHICGDEIKTEDETKAHIHAASALFTIIDEIRDVVASDVKERENTLTKEEIELLEAKREKCMDPAYEVNTKEYNKRVESDMDRILNW